MIALIMSVMILSDRKDLRTSRYINSSNNIFGVHGMLMLGKTLHAASISSLYIKDNLRSEAIGIQTIFPIVQYPIVVEVFPYAVLYKRFKESIMERSGLRRLTDNFSN